MESFVIITKDDIIGMCGHVSKDNANDIEGYIKRNGFVDSESAREAAEQLGIYDAKIKSVRL